MTKGDKIKLRAELAGKAMIGLISNNYFANYSNRETSEEEIAEWSVSHADALMSALGISMEDEK